MRVAKNVQYSLWAMARDGEEKGTRVACWYFEDLKMAKKYALQRCPEIVDGIIVIKNKQGEKIARVPDVPCSELPCSELPLDIWELICFYGPPVYNGLVRADKRIWNDKHHRKRIMTHYTTIETDKDGDKRWYLNGKRHREDGPAVEYAGGSKGWYINGKRHREDGPAIEYAGGEKEWYTNGKRHREGGPAAEYSDTHKEWWTNGVRQPVKRRKLDE